LSSLTRDTESECGFFCPLGVVEVTRPQRLTLWIKIHRH
jgi:hypothetical protein